MSHPLLDQLQLHALRDKERRAVKIGIFVINSEVFVKELGNGKLISHNAAYKPLTIHPFNSVYCCGKVLGTV